MFYPKPGTCDCCSVPIEVKSKKHRFCLAKCRKRWNRSQFKNTKNTFYRCSSCRSMTEMVFSPKNAPELWRSFVCPDCSFSPYNPKTESQIILRRAVC